MPRLIHRSLRALGTLSLAACSLAAQADTLDFHRSGQLASQVEVAQITFDIGSASDLRIWTDSWQAGANFDPLLALFGQDGGLLGLGDDIDAPFPAVSAAQGLLDAGLLFKDLAAGHYRLTVAASPNYPLGDSLSAGFSWDAEAPVAFGAGGQPGGQWSVQFSLTDAAPVPEPTTLALLLAGMLTLGLKARRQD